MRKYIPHILIISFIFLLAPTVHVATYAGEVEDAKEEVRKSPDDALVHNGLGLAYYKSGKYKEAIESFKQAIRIDHDYAGARFSLGFTYVNINDRDSALEQYEILKSLDTERAKELFDYIYE